jgi:hypothetical protein
MKAILALLLFSSTALADLTDFQIKSAKEQGLWQAAFRDSFDAKYAAQCATVSGVDNVDDMKAYLDIDKKAMQAQRQIIAKVSGQK